MAEGISLPKLEAVEAKKATEVLLEQERLLRYKHFGADNALHLGNAVIALTSAFGEGVSVTITHERDDVRMCCTWRFACPLWL